MCNVFLSAAVEVKVDNFLATGSVTDFWSGDRSISFQHPPVRRWSTSASTKCCSPLAVCQFYKEYESLTLALSPSTADVCF